jgi:hypothetical protein
MRSYKMYKYYIDPITKETYLEGIIRTVDNAFIPFDESNTDYQEYLKWLAEGNQPEQADKESK